ncbi:MAG: hypothetical protein NT096_02640 [Proteobacteria bacterium]|nr:hypothetical protein [Pseudomonadota bacterium]
MKKLIFLLMIGFAMVLGFLTGAQAATITVGEAIGKPGTEVSIPVTIDDTAGRLDCSFAVSFNTTLLEYTGKTSGNMGATILTATLAEINATGMVQPIVQFEEGGSTSGTIVYFKFMIKEATAIGTIIPLIISEIVPAEIYAGVSGKITVVETLCTVTISPSSASVYEGASQTFSASTNGQGCKTGSYTWSVSSTIGSTITQAGVYTAGSTAIEATDTITATDTANGNITAQAIVTVKPPFCTVTISPLSVTGFEGMTQTFSASTSGQGCKTGAYSWAVSSTIGSTITQNGLYTAGSTDAQVTDTITATDTANGNITAQAIVTVKPTFCTVTLSPPSVTVKEGESKTFSASTSGQNCSKGVYTWSVTSTIGSTITQQGAYTAGTTAVQATDTVIATDTANGNITGQATITVNPKTFAVTISPSSVTLDSGEKQNFKATTTADGEVISGSYTWEISPASAIGSTISSSSGLFTAGSNNSSNSIPETIVVADTANRNAQAMAAVTVLPIPPSSPVLISPENGYTSAPSQPAFTWELSDRAISYELKVATDPEFSQGSLKINQSGITGNSFTPDIPLSSEPYAPFYWKVTAVNDGGAVDSAIFTFILNVTGPQELVSEETLNKAKDAQDISAYQMISVPLFLENKDPMTVLGFDKCDSTVWRFFRYDSDMVTDTGEIGDYHEYDCSIPPDLYLDFEPGRAFWLITSEGGRTLNVIGDPVPTTEKFSIFLQSGWNQMGDPFAFPVDWMNVSVIDENGQEQPIYNQSLIEFDSIANSSLWEWNGDGYDRPSVMEPWTGYWVNVLMVPDTGLVELRVPPIVSVIPETEFSTPASAPLAVNKSEFVIKLMAQGKKTRDTYNYLGISSVSSSEYDERDILEPPQLSNKQVSLYFPHEDWKDRPGIYATDFRPPSAIDEPFTFIVAGGEKGEKVTLTWSGVNEVPAGYKVVLLHVKKGKVIDMKKVSTYSYKVDKKRAMEFQISFINNASSSLVDDGSTNFLEDELDDESMEDLDLY